jgi:hypothetical protein
LIALTALPAVADATLWLHVPIAKHIDRSDAVLVARLRETRSPREDVSGAQRATGTLELESALWSRRPTAKQVLLKWWVYADEDHFGDLVGDRVIWLVTQNKEGFFEVDHPGRAIPLLPQTIRSALSELRQEKRPSPRVKQVIHWLETELEKQKRVAR